MKRGGDGPDGQLGGPWKGAATEGVTRSPAPHWVSPNLCNSLGGVVPRLGGESWLCEANDVIAICRVHWLVSHQGTRGGSSEQPPGTSPPAPLPRHRQTSPELPASPVHPAARAWSSRSGRAPCPRRPLKPHLGQDGVRADRSRGVACGPRTREPSLPACSLGAGGGAAGEGGTRQVATVSFERPQVFGA